MKRICLFGGSFDPIHEGHITIAKAALETFSLDKVIFLPCARSPFKSSETLANDTQRLEMLNIATLDFDWAEISDHDLLLPPPSWSWRVVEDFQKLYPEAKLFWLMGTDQWASIKDWNQYEYFLTLVDVIVFKRATTPLIEHEELVSPLVLEGDHPAASSLIRTQRDSHRDWLSPKVYQYIQDHHLYT